MERELEVQQWLKALVKRGKKKREAYAGWSHEGISRQKIVLPERDTR